MLLRGVDLANSADVDAAFGLVRACELVALGSSDATRATVHGLLSGPDAVPSEHLLAFDGDHAVGLLAVEVDRYGRELHLDAYALGEAATVVQRTLLRRGLAGAARVARADPVPSAPAGTDPYHLSRERWQVVASSYAQDAQYRDLLTGLGFRQVRRFRRMERDLAGVPALMPEAPAGVTRSVVHGEADRRILHALWAESFAGHFGSAQDEPFESWIALLEGQPDADPSRWWIALQDDEPVGLCILDGSLAELGRGYVRTLGVRPVARRRGIGTWLLACAAADSADRGLSALALSVDHENGTGATAVYEAAGFTTSQVIDLWCYPLPSAPAWRLRADSR